VPISSYDKYDEGERHVLTKHQIDKARYMISLMHPLKYIKLVQLFPILGKLFPSLKKNQSERYIPAEDD
jgi:hypothetical protein